MTLAQVRALIRPTRRALHWEALLAFAVASIALVALVGYGRADIDLEVFGAVRRATMFLAMGAAFFVIDPAAVVVASVPPTLVRRRALSLAIGWSAVAGVWGVVLVIAELRAQMPIPSADLTIELVALTLFATAVGYVAERASGSGGLAGCIAVFAASLFLPAIPHRFTFIGGSPGDEVWAAAHLRWLVACALAACSLLVFSIDPARRMNRSVSRARQR